VTDFRWVDEAVEAFKITAIEDYFCVEIFRMDTSVFSCYSSQGTPTFSMLVVLYIGNRNPSRRMDGGELPRGGKIVEDPDGWIFGGLEFSPEFTNAASLMRGLSDMAGEMVALKRQQIASTPWKRLSAWLAWKQIRYGRIYRMLKAA
jgi:hypothetical protein